MTKTTLETLEKKLWGAADIMRGTVDSGDYKNYIFTLLALKRLNDVFQEEVEKLVAEGIPRSRAEKDHDFHTFFVPEKALWAGIPKLNKDNLGDALNEAIRAIERENPALANVLTIADFNDTHKLGDERSKRIRLQQLYQHFTDLHLADKDLADMDILGRAYEYLIKQFAEGAGAKGGEFFTPPEVVRLMVGLVKPEKGMRILDPTVGSGGFLLWSARHVRGDAKGKTTKDKVEDVNLSLLGQEINGSTWAICKLNMLLHGHAGARIERGDSIRDPKLLDDKGGLIQADIVLANPPFSLDNWGYDMWESGDSYGRAVYGVPPKTKGDFAFIQHMLAHASLKGKVATVVPHGVLFRSGKEGTIREGLLKDDLVEAVIGLGPNIFYGTGIPAAILVLNKAKPKERKGKVLIINAVKQLKEGRAQNTLTDDHIKTIRDAFDTYADQDLFCRVVDLKEIQENDYNLNITRYVDTTPPEKPIDVKEALKELRRLEKERDAAEARMNKLLAEMGYA